MAKYRPLFLHLASLSGDAWRATFSEIEAVLGVSLPPSARSHQAWWANDSHGHSHARAWLGAGWKTARLDLVAETVEFHREGDPVAQPSIARADDPRVSEFGRIRSPGTNEYDRLRAHLESFPGDLWEATFSEVEAVLGEPLPHSARRHRPWWSNGGGHPQTRAWRSAGWSTARVALEEETLEFRRAPATEPSVAEDEDPNRSEFRPDPSPGMNEYDRLRAYLESFPGDLWEATFAEVEAVLGEPLPYSARRHRPWWSNGGGQSQTRAWRSAGWKTAKVELEEETLEFRRDRAPAAEPSVAEEDDPDRSDFRPVRSQGVNKYDRLRGYLASLPGDRWEATFSEVEAVLGEPLPYSARKHRPWWSNGGGHTQTRAWRGAGWKTAKVDLQQETLEFRREFAPPPSESEPPLSEWEPTRSEPEMPPSEPGPTRSEPEVSPSEREPPPSEPEPPRSEPGLGEVGRIARRIAALPPDRWLAALREARAELDAAVLAVVRDSAAPRRGDEAGTPEAGIEGDAESRPPTGAASTRVRRGAGQGRPSAPDSFEREPAGREHPDPDHREPARFETDRPEADANGLPVEERPHLRSDNTAELP